MNPKYVQFAIAFFVICQASVGEESVIDEFVPDRQIELVSNLVILSARTEEITTQPNKYTFPDELEVWGSFGFLCLVIADGYEYAGSRQRFDIHERIVAHVGLQAIIDVGDNRRMKLTDPAYSWNRKGRVLDGSELSTCMRISTEKIHNDEAINFVELSARKPLTVKGVYWESSNEFE